MDGCSITLIHCGKKAEMCSNCKYHYDFSMGSAKSSSPTTPCTNVLLHCLLPASQFDKHISRLELSRLGVPSEVVTSWRQAADIPNTSDIEPDSDEAGQPASGKGKAVARGAGTKAGQKRPGAKPTGASEMPQVKKNKTKQCTYHVE